MDVNLFHPVTATLNLVSNVEKIFEGRGKKNLKNIFLSLFIIRWLELKQLSFFHCECHATVDKNNLVKKVRLLRGLSKVWTI